MLTPELFGRQYRRIRSSDKLWASLTWLFRLNFTKSSCHKFLLRLNLLNTHKNNMPPKYSRSYSKAKTPLSDEYTLKKEHEENRRSSIARSEILDYMMFANFQNKCSEEIRVPCEFLSAPRKHDEIAKRIAMLSHYFTQHCDNFDFVAQYLSNALTN